MTATRLPRSTHRGAEHPLRRIGAITTDIAIVLAWPATAAVFGAERFPLLNPPGGGPRLAPADQTRLEGIGEGFHRIMEWNGQLYAFGTRAWILSFLALVAAAVLMGLAFPRLSIGRTPGRFLFRLPAVTRPGGTLELDDEPDVDAAAAVAHVIDLGPLPKPAADRPAEPSEALIVLTGGVRRPTDASQPNVELDLDLDPPVDLADPPSIDVDLPSDLDRDRDLDRDSDVGAAPSDRWLGDDEDYVRWIRESSAPSARRSIAPATTMRYENLVFPESSLSERPLKKMAALAPSETSAETPIWSDNHEAWLFHDHRTDLWYRHDAGSGRWLPIDLCGA